MGGWVFWSSRQRAETGQDKTQIRRWKALDKSEKLRDELQAVEADNRTDVCKAVEPGSEQNETKRITTKANGQERNEAEQAISSVAGKKTTKRSGQTKRTEGDEATGVESGHTTGGSAKGTAPNPTAKSKAKRTGTERAGAKRAGKAATGRTSTGRTRTSATAKPGSYIPPDRAYQSARELLDNEKRYMEREIAIAEGREKPLRYRTPRDIMLEAVAESPTSDILEAGVEVYNLPKIDLCDRDAVRQRLSEFFSIYARRGLRPTVAGMAMSLGIDRRRLWEIRTGRAKELGRQEMAIPREVRDEIKDAYNIMENLWESYMVSGKLNPVTGIYIGRNQFGYLDRIDYNVNVPVEEPVRTADEILERYAYNDQGDASDIERIETDFTD